jgi:hypothetical protein
MQRPALEFAPVRGVRCSARALAVCFAVTALALPLAASAGRGSAVPSAAVTGPIAQNAPPGDPSHDYIFFTTQEDLSDFGYVEEEYFVEGQANRYATPPLATGSILSSGHPYKTRIVVRRPIDRRDANGIVLFEWQNVSAGYEIDAHWGPSWEHFVRHGYTWVGISAQRVGVHGFGTPGGVDRGLTDWSPLRYGTLDVTVGGTIVDDSLSYDVFAQSAQALLRPTGSVDPLRGIRVVRAFAVGASQSAGRLTVYHNSIHPLHELFDGFYLLVGGGPLRTDLDVKVLRYLSENDVMRAGPGIRQDDSRVLVTHEVAGAGHSSFVSNVYREPLLMRDFGEIPFPPNNCNLPPFSRAPGHHVIDRNYDQLTLWVRFGLRPPASPRLEFDESVPAQLVRDDLGIAVGGIRLAAVEVPIALNSGENSGGAFCVLYGTHQPFDDETLRELYPRRGEYAREVTRVTVQNLLRGFITFENAIETIAEAHRAEIPPR